jgi:hypothetical protein
MYAKIGVIINNKIPAGKNAINQLISATPDFAAV